MPTKNSVHLDACMSDTRNRRIFLQRLFATATSAISARSIAQSKAVAVKGFDTEAEISTAKTPPHPATSNADSASPMLAGTLKHTSNIYAVALMNAQGVITQQHQLPDRGHDCVFRPDGRQLVVFARRPGTFMYVIDVASRQLLHQHAAAAARHFYGHGCFNAQGTLLYVTENDYARARGVIGVYDVQKGYERVGEFDSHGIGPHDIVRQNDNATIIVANGGIETHPDTGRDKLNLQNMRSNLSVINRHTGELLQQFDLPAELKQLSLRHMALDAQGDCYFGGQYEGAEHNHPPLLGVLRHNGDFSIWQTPHTLRLPMNNYVSSICTVPGHPLLLASSAKGGVALLCNTIDGGVEQVFNLNDCSGVAALNDRLYISDGFGHLSQFTNNTDHWANGPSLRIPDIHWDNHMTSSQIDA